MKKIFLSFIILLFTFQIYSKPLIFVRGDDNYPPYEMKQNGKLVGIHIELIQEVAKILSVEVQIKEVPWRRALEMVKRNKADAILYVTKSDKRKEFIDFNDGNIMTGTNISLFCLKKNYSNILKKIDKNDKDDLKVGVIRGFYYGANFEKMNFKNKIFINKLDQQIKLLRHSRVDLFVASETDITYRFVNNPEELNDIKIIKPYVRKTKNYLGFSKNNIKISKKFALIMRSFRNTEKFKNIMKKYNYIDNH